MSMVDFDDWFGCKYGEGVSHFPLFIVCLVLPL